MNVTNVGATQFFHQNLIAFTSTLARAKALAGMLFAAVLLVSATFAGSAHAASPTINTLDKSGVFGKFKQTGIAVRGYDTVAYFTLSKPVKGNQNFKSDWNGATWYFSSQDHKELFDADPVKYAPQYGGYCAYGIANDYVVKIDPAQWKIVDDKLYLNYDSNIQKRWLKNIDGYIVAADRKLDALLAK